MKSDPLLHEGRDPHREPSAGRAGALSLVPQRVGARLLHELSRALPPTIFFFVADYAAAVSNFLLATLATLVVGKAMITANAIPVITRFDRAPLIQPILF